MHPATSSIRWREILPVIGPLAAAAIGDSHSHSMGKTRSLSITRTTTRGEEHDFQSCTSRRSFEGLPGRHHRCRGLKAIRCDPGASFADSERAGGYFCFHVLASFSGATHIARLLAKDAGAARSLAGAAKEAAQDTAVSKSRAVGLTTFRRESKV